MAEKIRLQVALARLGFASRRTAARLIKAGKVKVNGRTILRPGERVELKKDNLTVNGKSSCIQKNVYYLINKPKGVVTTVKDKHAKRCVLDLIKPKNVRIYPVGRLDKDTAGLLLLTNDGELAFRLAHPKFGVKKVYRVCLRGELKREKLRKLQSGILLEGKKTFPCRIKIVSQSKKLTNMQIWLSEGRKRQIKKMFAALGHPVLSIERIAFGPLKLGKLKTGRWRGLTREELAKVKRISGVIN